MAEDLRLGFAGESALIAYPAGEDEAHVFAQVQALAAALPEALGDALVDLVPSYASLLIVYDALRCDHYQAAGRIRDAARALPAQDPTAGRLVEIPVFYGSEVAEDLQALAKRSGLDPGEVIALHSGREYRVYAIGFAPGFAYLGHVDERIAAPRLSTPRQRVPRGAVGIADRQTAIYPATSPGGWNIIGRSPLRMFDPDGRPPMPVTVGDRVRFCPVDREAFLAEGGEL
jgi:KipI family sensor histidine kinase inhibitor